MHSWLNHFGFKKYGLPVEIKGGEGQRSQWEIPEAERGLHASGHACGPDLLDVARGIGPEVLIPVHSEHPEFYTRSLEDNLIKVILTTIGIRFLL